MVTESALMHGYIPSVLWNKFQERRAIYDNLNIEYPWHEDWDISPGTVIGVSYKDPLTIYGQYIASEYTRREGLVTSMRRDGRMVDVNGNVVTAGVVGTRTPEGNGGGAALPLEEILNGDQIMQIRSTDTYGGWLQFVNELNAAKSLTEQINLIVAKMQQIYTWQQDINEGGYAFDRGAQQNLIIPEANIIRERLKAEVEKWRRETPGWQMLMGAAELYGGRGMINIPQSLYRRLQDANLHQSISAELGVNEIEISREVEMMLASGASGIMMILTKGNFPMAAAAYFGVQSVIGQGFNDRDLYAGTKGEGGMFDGMPITPMNVEIPEGLPNEIFAEYRYICYDRLAGRWYPTDLIRPLAYDSAREEYRWFCLDRVSGKVYKANLIKKPRIYLD